MKFPRSALAILALAPVASAQDNFLPTGPNPVEGGTPEDLRLRVMPGAPQNRQIAWWSILGRTYIPEKSTDLVTWEPFPVIETGANAAVSYGFTGDSPRLFVRLHHVPSPSGDPYTADFDGDGLSNADELAARTSPFDSDTDDDQLPDNWEVENLLSARVKDAASDADGDGRTNLQEYQAGTNPQDYYNGAAPTIATLEGAGQAGPPGSFLPKPWTVQVRNTAGVVLVNAPVTFTVPAGQGGLAASPDSAADPLPATLTVRTDALGLAWVYWKL